MDVPRLIIYRLSADKFRACACQVAVSFVAGVPAGTAISMVVGRAVERLADIDFVCFLVIFFYFFGMGMQEGKASCRLLYALLGARCLHGHPRREGAVFVSVNVSWAPGAGGAYGLTALLPAATS